MRHHASGTAGLIHIVDASDYVELAKTLRVPEEVVRYFKYREEVLTGFGGNCAHVPEPAIAGHFVGADPALPPVVASAQHLHRLLQDDQEWDLAPFLRRLYQGLSVPDLSDDYYDILIEFAKLPRSMWREVKKRILLCIDKARNDEFVKPYRTVFPPTDCGFVFIPAPTELVSHPEWATTFRLRGLQQMTQAHKYDQRLSKCIGIQVAKDGEYFDIVWCLIDHPWIEDPEFQKRLDDNFPFRQVKGALVHGYHLSDG